MLLLFIILLLETILMVETKLSGHVTDDLTTTNSCVRMELVKALTTGLAVTWEQFRVLPW